MRTEEEIKAMVEKLKELKPSVRETSAFGDNHHDAIDAQIRVLEEGIDSDGIEEEFGDDNGTPQNVYDAADQIYCWRTGDTSDEDILLDYPMLK